MSINDFLNGLLVDDSEHIGSLLVYSIVVVGLVGAILIISHFLGQRRSDLEPENKANLDPFESGIVSVGDARLRFSAPFFLVAIFFVIFDLEAVFLFAWVIGFEESGWAGFIEACVFISILLAALVYLWKLGALDWSKSHRKHPRPPVYPIDNSMVDTVDETEPRKKT